MYLQNGTIRDRLMKLKIPFFEERKPTFTTKVMIKPVPVWFEILKEKIQTYCV